LKRVIAFIIFFLVLVMHISASGDRTHYESCDPSSLKKLQMSQIPHLKNSWQIQDECSFPSVHNVSYVIEMFYSNWKVRFGDPDEAVKKTLNNLIVEWGSKKKVILGAAFNVQGEPMKGEARGLTLMPTYIWVWTNPTYKRIAATALIHELVHSAIWSQNKYHGDPDHEGKDFRGWTAAHTEFIKELNRVLAYKDI